IHVHPPARRFPPRQIASRDDNPLESRNKLTTVRFYGSFALLALPETPDTKSTKFPAKFPASRETQPDLGRVETRRREFACSPAIARRSGANWKVCLRKNLGYSGGCRRNARSL